MSVADRIREEMEKRHISQNRLAKLAQISQAGLNSILHGKASPRENTLQAIAKALGLRVSDLVESAETISENIPPRDIPNLNITLIARGMEHMTEDQQKRMITMARAAFPDVFKEEDLE